MQNELLLSSNRAIVEARAQDEPDQVTVIEGDAAQLVHTALTSVPSANLMSTSPESIPEGFPEHPSMVSGVGVDTVNERLMFSLDVLMRYVQPPATLN